ncbi:FAD-binding oxidoreductase [Chitinimonas lacunae]|uniref:FAD-binding oxidoreductase n=1 Tax=Chitinimonas lacunae TaxID=1963018 RepID=A0ABV8MVY2_9NEIS
MRRWNGWGDDALGMTLNDNAIAMLTERVGAGHKVEDASLESVLAQVPPSPLAGQHGVDISPRARYSVALGESYPDWIKKRFGVAVPVPDGVVYPETSAEVRHWLDRAGEQGWQVIPYGGGTSVAGHLDCPAGSRPVLSLNLSRMTRLLHLDQGSQLATLGAGAPGPVLEAQLRAHGYTLGHFPQSFEYSTVGGWVVTRSSGQQSLRYGRIEQLFAGGRFETPIGTLELPTFPASSAGPDLRELVLGSEGRFGVLTEAVMRVSRLPEHESFHALFFPDWERAEAAVRELVRAKLPLSMLRLSNAIETLTNLTLAGHADLIRWLERYLGWRGCPVGDKCMLMLGVSADRRSAAQALASARRLSRQHGGVYIGRRMGDKWRDNRFKGPYLRNTLWEHGYAADTIETAVDWPRVKPLMQAMEQAARDAFAEDGERVHAFTHLSHLYSQGSSIYSTFVYRIAPGGFAPNLERWRRYKARVSEAIVSHGGTISHQHGVGSDHAPYLPAEKGPLGMATLAELCRHFDPQGIMNPGKLLQDPPR